MRETPLTRRAAIASALAAPLLMASAPARAASGPDLGVITSNGPVLGRREDGLSVFRGLRYGSDSARFRFARPAPPQPWRDPVPGFEFGPVAPQRRAREPMSEDCLVLNVWTPGIADGARRPIMVYIHGGAYASGSGADPLTDGARLAAAEDVVVITLNHRLNAFGYLSLGRLFPDRFADSGNAGQWDLVLALEWVRANALAFGGDPDRVLLFGQSGGGAKIATLMAAEAASGLFHAVATMSGQQVTASGPLNAQARAEAYLRALGFDPNAAETADRLLAAPVDALVAALEAPDPIDPSRGGVYFGPVFDDRLLRRHPFWPDAPPISAHIPMVLGNTRDETRTLIGRAEPEAFNLTWADLPAWLARHLRVDIGPETVIAAYRQNRPELSAPDVFFAATTASRSWRGQVEEAEARARQGAPTWVYRFDQPSPRDGGRWGAPHTIDIAHAFRTIHHPDALTGTSPDDHAVSHALSRALVALARSGDPNHGGLPAWPHYTSVDRATMLFGPSPQVAFDPRGWERELFGRAPFVQWGT